MRKAKQYAGQQNTINAHLICSFSEKTHSFRREKSFLNSSLTNAMVFLWS